MSRTLRRQDPRTQWEAFSPSRTQRDWGCRCCNCNKQGRKGLSLRDTQAKEWWKKELKDYIK
jgi:hypothetical protein